MPLIRGLIFISAIAVGADPCPIGELQSGGQPPRIATQGVKLSKDVAQLNLLPRGAALITGSGNLAATGITAIIHAASGQLGKGGTETEPSVESVAFSVANAMTLAKANGHKRVAIPFIGGGTYLDRIGCSPNVLAEAIVKAALDNRGDIELRFVMYSHYERDLFQKALKKLRPQNLSREKVRVVQGSITDFQAHQATAIVNASNCMASFGAGVSGIIGDATGKAAEINQEARTAVDKFNQDLLRSP